MSRTVLSALNEQHFAFSAAQWGSIDLLKKNKQTAKHTSSALDFKKEKEFKTSRHTYS